MSEIKIEKGIPLPSRPRRGGSKEKYPWSQCSVGDSFFVPGASTQNFGGVVDYQRKKSDKQYSVRAVDGGVRVWRVS